MGLFDIVHLNVSERARAEAKKEVKKTNKLLREQNALLRRQSGGIAGQSGLTLEGSLMTLTWDGSWLVGRASTDLPRGTAFLVRREEFRLHRDMVVAVENEPPKVAREGNLKVSTREGKTHSIGYKRARQDEFASLAEALDLATRPQAPAIPPPPPPSAGWFAAPDRPGWMRYWDGTGWTEHYHDQSQPPQA